MQQHGGILLYLLGVKEDRHERTYTVWFHSYKIPENAPNM